MPRIIEPPIFVPELATLLGYHRTAVYRALPELYRQKFPRPVIAGKGRMRWDRASVLVWIERYHPDEDRRRRRARREAANANAEVDEAREKQNRINEEYRK